MVFKFYVLVKGSMGLNDCLDPVSQRWRKTRELLVDARRARRDFRNAETGSEYAVVAQQYSGSRHLVERFYGSRAKKRARRDWDLQGMSKQELDQEFIIGD